jgi:hypothetical protein
MAAGEAAAATSLPTNIDLLVEAVEQSVDQGISGMALPAEAGMDVLVITARTPHSGNWLVEHVLAERLLNRGFSVSLDSTRAAGHASRLSFRVLDLGVSGRGGLLRSAIRRQAHATIALRLSKDNVLSWQGECTATVEDQIPTRRADLLEVDEPSFARVDLQTQSWGQFVEPVIVSTVLGGLVYMFFSNR